MQRGQALSVTAGPPDLGSAGAPCGRRGDKDGRGRGEGLDNVVRVPDDDDDDDDDDEEEEEEDVEGVWYEGEGG